MEERDYLHPNINPQLYRYPFCWNVAAARKDNPRSSPAASGLIHPVLLVAGAHTPYEPCHRIMSFRNGEPVTTKESISMFTSEKREMRARRGGRAKSSQAYPKIRRELFESPTNSGDADSALQRKDTNGLLSKTYGLSATLPSQITTSTTMGNRPRVPNDSSHPSGPTRSNAIGRV